MKRRTIDIMVMIAYAAACALVVCWMCSCSAYASLSRDRHEEAHEREEMQLSLRSVESSDVMDVVRMSGVQKSVGRYHMTIYDTSAPSYAHDGNTLPPVLAVIDGESETTHEAEEESLTKTESESITDTDASAKHATDNRKEVRTDTDMGSDMLNGAFVVMALFAFITLFIRNK